MSILVTYRGEVALTDLRSGIAIYSHSSKKKLY